MRLYIKSLILISCVSGGNGLCNAYNPYLPPSVNIEVDGLHFDIYDQYSDNYASITSVYNNETYIDTLTIPETVNYEGKAFVVKEMETDACQDKIIENLFMSENLKTIGAYAFYGTEVRNLYIPDLKNWCDKNFKTEKISDSYSIYPWARYSIPIGHETQIYIAGEKISDVWNIDTPGLTYIFDFPYLNIEKIIIGPEIRLISTFNNSTIKEFVGGDGLNSIDGYTFLYCENLETLTFTGGPLKIWPFSFAGCPIKRVNISSVDNWAQSGFDAGGSLEVNPYVYPPLGFSYDLYLDGEKVEDVVITSAVTELEGWSFAGSNIKSVICEEGLISTGTCPFNYCSQLESITFPSSLEFFECNFYGCDNLKRITVKAQYPPKLEKYSWFDDYDIYYLIRNDELLENCVVEVPEGSVEFYRNDALWGLFKNIIPIGGASGVEEIGAVDSLSGPKAVYDLHGRKVSGENLAPGIYVIDGKKIKI